jgi:hypothetical protein
MTAISGHGRLPLVMAMLSLAAGVQAADAPPDTVSSRRAIAIARALSYDASLPDRTAGEMVLLILFKKKNAPSEKGADLASKAFKQLETLRIAGAPFRRVTAPFNGAAELEQMVQKEGVDAFFLCDGLEDDLPAIKQVSRQKKVLTLGTTEAQVRAGVSLAVIAEGTKMVIALNLPESREEGAAFSSDLLRLAKVMR